MAGGVERSAGCARPSPAARTRTRAHTHLGRRLACREGLDRALLVVELLGGRVERLLELKHVLPLQLLLLRLQGHLLGQRVVALLLGGKLDVEPPRRLRSRLLRGTRRCRCLSERRLERRLELGRSLSRRLELTSVLRLGDRPHARLLAQPRIGRARHLDRLGLHHSRLCLRGLGLLGLAPREVRRLLTLLRHRRLGRLCRLCPRLRRLGARLGDLQRGLDPSGKV